MPAGCPGDRGGKLRRQARHIPVSLAADRGRRVVSESVTLSLRATPEEPLEADSVAADRFAGLTEREIAALPVCLGSRAATLGDFFDVRGERSPRVRIEGDV